MKSLSVYEKVAAVGLDVHDKFSTVTMRDARGKVVRRERLEHADLLSLLPYEGGDWWKVWMSPPEVGNQRETMRYRSSLVGVQTETKNRICGLLHRHGVLHGFADLFGAGGRKFLAELSREGRWDQGTLLPGAVTGLRGVLELLDHVRGQLARIARESHGKLEATPLARRLDGIPGFGMILAHTILSEIGRVERFGDPRRWASYSLLAPIARETGEAVEGTAPLGRRVGWTCGEQS